MPLPVLGLAKQLLWDRVLQKEMNCCIGTHFLNSLVDTWAKEVAFEWVYHIPHDASGKIKQCNGLLKTTLRAVGVRIFKHWHLAFSEGHLVSEH